MTDLVACLVILGAAQLFESPGAPFLAEPTLPEKHRYWLNEFQTLDTNRDRQISADEYERNGRKVVDEAERLVAQFSYKPALVSMLYAKHSRTGHKLPLLDEIDRNGDGQIDFHREYLTFPVELYDSFSRWDQNSDGSVTRDEYVAARLQKHASLAKEVNGNPESIYFPLAKLPPAKVESEFTFRDRNGDGIATWKEFLAFHDALPNKLAEGMNAEDAFFARNTDFDPILTEDEFLKHARESEQANVLAWMERAFRLKDVDENKQITIDEFLTVRTNDVSQFFGRDKNEDGVLQFNEVAGANWVGHGKHKQRDQTYFARLDHNGDEEVTWDEYRTTSVRQFGFSALDHLNVDNQVSLQEWKAVEQLYHDPQNGPANLAKPWAYYATMWMPGIFDLIHFEELDANRDSIVTWSEFQAFPDAP